VQLAGVVTPADKDSTWARDQVEALRDMLEKRFKGVDKAHRLAVLGQAATFTPMGISPKDAQFIELMRWTRSDACMVYGVPPELIGDQEGATYNNVREAHKGFWTDTMIPLAQMLTQELTEQLLPKFKQPVDRAEFDLSGVQALQADMKETAEQAKVWASIGVPLNRILSELAPQFLNEGEGWEWGDSPASVQEPQAVTRGEKFAEYPGLRFIAPQAVRDAARKGLRLYEEGRGGDGLQPKTVAEARTIAGRQDVSPDKLRRMRAWFARHESDKRPGWDRAGKETPGYVAWLLWGGDAGRSWAIKMVAEMNRIDSGKERGATKAIKPITRGSVEHKAAYEEFGRRADALMRSFKREITEVMQEQERGLKAKLREQAAKALDNEADIDSIWDEVFWGALFADALLTQIQVAAELGAVSTLRQLRADTALFDLDAPEVRAAMQVRAQKFAEQVNETTWDKLKTSLMDGIQGGEGIDELETRVEMVMGDRIRSSAETIARTETVGALTEGSLMGARDAAATGLDVRKQWLATFDGREREEHAQAHDIYQASPIALDDVFIVGGVQFTSPGNPVGFGGAAEAAQSINCRCALTYVVGDDTTTAGVITSDVVAKFAEWLDQ
jgi:hypothetical protein